MFVVLLWPIRLSYAPPHGPPSRECSWSLVALHTTQVSNGLPQPPASL